MKATCRLLVCALVPVLLWPIGPARSAENATATPLVPAHGRAAEYRAETPKSIVELQQFRHLESAAIEVPHAAGGHATLVNLNPTINSWFLLTIEARGEHKTFHLENPNPQARRISLKKGGVTRLVIAESSGDHECEPWAGSPSVLESARRAAQPYVPLCDGRLLLRNPTAGSKTRLERITDLLRDQMRGGESIVGFMRDKFFRDSFVEAPSQVSRESGGVPETPGAPPCGAIAPAVQGTAVQPGTMGIAVDDATSKGLTLGRWYPASGLAGVFVSVVRPAALAPCSDSNGRGTAEGLDPIESAALDYLVSFDLEKFDLRFALGTDHPRLGWSSRPPAPSRNAALPGPDGIGTAEPLAATGIVSPALDDAVVATFTGGFKREHGAFKYGPLSLINHGSHYGFIEEGIVLSKLQPGLATLFVLDDGAVHMKTWSGADDVMLARVRYARQNGVALVEPDASGTPGPGALVGKWGPGNWSGSAEGSLRSLRAGACLSERAERHFLIYGYFSAATPSAMARVFQAYGCRHAMLLDMNALEHTYLALYARRGERFMVEHLVEGMGQIDKSIDGRLVPRFIGFPDNRDFFYLTRRRGAG